MVRTLGSSALAYRLGVLGVHELYQSRCVDIVQPRFGIGRLRYLAFIASATGSPSANILSGSLSQRVSHSRFARCGDTRRDRAQDDRRRPSCDSCRSACGTDTRRAIGP